MQNLALHNFSMTEYLGEGPSGIELVPEVGAIYIWTLDFTRFQRLSPQAAISELARLGRLPLRQFEGRVSPFYHVGIADVPPGLGDDRLAKLATILECEEELATWILLYATCVQRPLYVGQASNLRRRFRTHVAAGSPFRGYLDEAELRLRDCALGYVELPRTLDTELIDSDIELAAEEDFGASAGNGALDVLEALLQRTARPLLGRRLE